MAVHEILVVLPPVTTLSLLAFIERLTENEWEDIELAAAHNPGDTNADKRKAARLRARLRRLDSYPVVNLQRNWVRNLVTSLETSGAIAAGRAVQILDTPVANDERA